MSTALGSKRFFNSFAPQGALVWKLIFKIGEGALRVIGKHTKKDIWGHWKC
jgi:hypothetical protein